MNRPSPERLAGIRKRIDDWRPFRSSVGPTDADELLAEIDALTQDVAKLREALSRVVYPAHDDIWQYEELRRVLTETAPKEGQP